MVYTRVAVEESAPLSSSFKHGTSNIFINRSYDTLKF